MTSRTKNFRCELCGKAFTQNRDLVKHKARKKPCTPILDETNLTEEQKNSPHKCKFCGRTFASRPNMTRHLRQNCNIVPRDGDTSGMEKLYEHTLKKQMQDMMKKMESLEAALKQTTTKPAPEEAIVMAKAAPKEIRVAVAGTRSTIDQSVKTTNIDQSTKNTNIDQSTKTINNVQINVFGQEDISHITGGKIKQLFDDIIGKGAGELKELLPAVQMAIVQATMLIYSDEKHPENITCYLPNKKTDDVLVHGETGWEIKPYSIAVSPMAARAINVLFDKQPAPGMDGVDETADIEQCGRVLRHLADNEKELTVRPPSLRPVLVRNKDILAKYLAKLPVARGK